MDGPLIRRRGVPGARAAKFHRRAAATALHNLARALSDAEGIDRARPRWREAAAILAEFTDPRSAALRTEIDQILASA